MYTRKYNKYAFLPMRHVTLPKGATNPVAQFVRIVSRVLFRRVEVDETIPPVLSMLRQWSNVLRIGQGQLEVHILHNRQCEAEKVYANQL